MLGGAPQIKGVTQLCLSSGLRRGRLRAGTPGRLLRTARLRLHRSPCSCSGLHSTWHADTCFRDWRRRGDTELLAWMIHQGRVRRASRVVQNHLESSSACSWQGLADLTESAHDGSQFLKVSWSLAKPAVFKRTHAVFKRCPNKALHCSVLLATRLEKPASLVITRVSWRDSRRGHLLRST